MTYQNIINIFFEAVESGNIEKVLSFFAEDAQITSPIFKKMAPKEFYQKLFKEIEKLEFKVLRFFSCEEEPSWVAVDLIIKVTLKSNKEVESECADFIEFSKKDNKIQSIRILYDPRSVEDEIKQ